MSKRRFRSSSSGHENYRPVVVMMNVGKHMLLACVFLVIWIQASACRTTTSKNPVRATETSVQEPGSASPQEHTGGDGGYVNIIQGHRTPALVSIEPGGEPVVPFIPKGIKKALRADDLGNPESVETMLNSRVGISYIWDRFYDLNQVAFAFMGIVIVCEHPVCGRSLGQFYPAFYDPTWREYLDAVALVSGSHWDLREMKRKDGSTVHAFVFSEPAKQLSYAIALAPGWNFGFRGNEVNYYPTIAEVGMDIYDFGEYSGDGDPLEQAKEYWALRFARPFDANIEIEGMQREQVDGNDALYWEAPVSHRDAVWRQWVFAGKGRCYAIVSIIRNVQADKLEPEVMQMVSSFRAR